MPDVDDVPAASAPVASDPVEPTLPGLTDETEPVAPAADDDAAGVAPSDDAAPAPTSPAATPSPFAGRFPSAEHAYWHAQGELAALRGQEHAKPAAPQPTYTVDQLWTIRAHKLQELVAAQAGGQADQAATAAANLNWIDNEIQQQRLTSLESKLSATQALSRLTTDGAELLKPYQADLVPGNPLYEQAQEYFGQIQQAVKAGIPMENVLSGLAVLAAAAKTGKHTAGVQQQARAEFADALNKAAKQAVVAGAGRASKAPTGQPDLLNISDAEFLAYKKGIGVEPE